ncbi:MAG: TetR family transcriptional regulator, partial [Micrococcales bacterium]|nr:TetR family transcriptional regulator [Micrococcales bacterium]
MRSAPDASTRDRIRDAAIAAFAERGFDAASLRDIAQRAGVSAALIVHHFGSKDGLREECAAYVVQTLVTRVNGQGGDKPGTGNKGSLRNPDALARDQKTFDAVKRELLRKMEVTPELKKLAQQVRFIPTDSGLRIDLVDNADYSMFSMGTTSLEPAASQLIGTIAKTVADVPNTIMIRGHTDSVPYGDPRAMNNWMLSSGRAEATRRRLAAGGLPESRFERIVNFNATVVETADTVIFLRKIVRGASDNSYGIEVAKMAGMPP